ncbi:MAG: penicillin-binding protein 2 [bacterium]
MASGRERVGRDGGRVWIACGLVVILFLVIIGRLFYLQVLKTDYYQQQASNQRTTIKGLEPIRGSIYAQEKGKELYPVATNIKRYIVFVDPKMITDREAVVKALPLLVAVTEEEIKAKLDGQSRYEVLAKDVDEDIAQKILELKLAGVGALAEAKRLYPDSRFGGQLLGFVGYQGEGKRGQYGIEGAYENVLAGQPGKLVGEKSVGGAVIPLADQSVQPAVDGDDLVLTIDRAIQYQACSEVEKGIREYQASAGTIIVVDVKSGAILALCGAPDFDPNNYSQADPRSFSSPAVSGAYEPGSVFKAITMAAGLDLGKVTPSSTYVDGGQVVVDNFVIKNSDEKAHGVQTMTGVLELSLNTGVIHVVKLVGREFFQSYVKQFGFGEITGIDMAGETTGTIVSLDKKSLSYLYTAAFGQGLTATPIQMVMAYAAIANNGTLMPPYLVAELRKPDGAILKTKPKAIRQVIAPRTALLLQGMLVSVVKNGHSKKAAVPGYLVAGKTGTAQVASRGGYAKGATIQTFVGFAPADNPRFAALVRYDNPASNFAEGTAVPSFKRIAEFLFNYWQIPPNQL